MGTDRKPNKLVEARFVMGASKTINKTSDTVHQTSRGYDYKLFVSSVDDDLIANNFSPLRELAITFCDVSTNPHWCTNPQLRGNGALTLLFSVHQDTDRKQKTSTRGMILLPAGTSPKTVPKRPLVSSSVMMQSKESR
jgi:hypothetical protein